MMFQRALHYDTSQFAFLLACGRVGRGMAGEHSPLAPHHTRWAIRYIGAKFFATPGTLALHPNRPLVEDKDDYVAQALSIMIGWELLHFWYGLYSYIRDVFLLYCF